MALPAERRNFHAEARQALKHAEDQIHLALAGLNGGWGGTKVAQEFVRKAFKDVTTADSLLEEFFHGESAAERAMEHAKTLGALRVTESVWRRIPVHVRHQATQVLQRRYIIGKEADRLIHFFLEAGLSDLAEQFGVSIKGQAKPIVKVLPPRRRAAS